MNLNSIKSIEANAFHKPNGDTTVRLDIETEDGQLHVIRMTPLQWANMIQNITHKNLK